MTRAPAGWLARGSIKPADSTDLGALRRSGRARSWSVSLIGLAALLVVGCAQRVNRPDDAPFVLEDLVETQVMGKGFRHRVYRRAGETLGLADARRLHVYLDGDGRPWSSRHRVALDPTGRDPLVLRLMIRDPVSSLYLGRPCYHGFVEDPACRPWLWTHGRYGPEVLESMLAALANLLPEGRRPRITLIGYSGGGVLSLLIAGRLEGVERVVTIAANLDLDAWVDHHGYTRLGGSFNPATQPPLDRRIAQLHLVGGRDRRVPPATLALFQVRNPSARIKVIPDFDHHCCWSRSWPGIIDGSGWSSR